MKFLKYVAIIPAVVLAAGIAQAQTVNVGAASKDVEIKAGESLTVSYKLKANQYLVCSSEDAIRSDTKITWTYKGSQDDSRSFPINFKADQKLGIDAEMVDVKGAITIEDTCDEDDMIVTCEYKTVKK